MHTAHKDSNNYEINDCYKHTGLFYLQESPISVCQILTKVVEFDNK